MVLRRDPVLAGAAYFALVFTLGFVLGIVRVLWLAPRFGGEAAILLELPVMLIASLIAARWLLVRFRIEDLQHAAVMGATGFVLLILAEAALVSALSPQGLVAWFAASLEPPGLWGFLGQLGFAAMPLAVLATAKRKAD